MARDLLCFSRMLHRSPSNSGAGPSRPPAEPSVTNANIGVFDGDRDSSVWDADDRRETEPDDLWNAPESSRPFPPEALFGLRETDHVALRPRRGNAQIAVMAFILMMVLSLLALFLRARLHRELEPVPAQGSVVGARTS